MKIDQHKELTRPSQSYRHALPRGVEIYESYMNNNSQLKNKFQPWRLHPTWTRVLQRMKTIQQEKNPRIILLLKLNIEGSSWKQFIYMNQSRRVRRKLQHQDLFPTSTEDPSYSTRFITTDMGQRRCRKASRRWRHWPVIIAMQDQKISRRQLNEEWTLLSRNHWRRQWSTNLQQEACLEDSRENTTGNWENSEATGSPVHRVKTSISKSTLWFILFYGQLSYSIGNSLKLLISVTRKQKKTITTNFHVTCWSS